MELFPGLLPYQSAPQCLSKRFPILPGVMEHPVAAGASLAAQI